MTELLAGVLDVVQLAHDTQVPHREPAASGGGASPVLIVAGVVVSLALVAALVWVKRRVDSDTATGEGT